MKRIDWYLIRSFISPFVGTFFIALFVLILQVLWVYIDDIIGKGSSLLFILEMVFYLSMSLVPWLCPSLC
ncbi:MAG: LptF/LptG family permease [Saprospiraceae bacterium]|nr:LptF/LptG family permease [Saprospiraceae bacterium]